MYWPQGQGVGSAVFPGRCGPAKADGQRHSASGVSWRLAVNSYPTQGKVHVLAVIGRGMRWRAVLVVGRFTIAAGAVREGPRCKGEAHKDRQPVGGNQV